MDFLSYVLTPLSFGGRNYLLFSWPVFLLLCLIDAFVVGYFDIQFSENAPIVFRTGCFVLMVREFLNQQDSHKFIFNSFFSYILLRTLSTSSTKKAFLCTKTFSSHPENLQRPVLI